MLFIIETLTGILTDNKYININELERPLNTKKSFEHRVIIIMIYEMRTIYLIFIQFLELFHRH